MAVKRYRGPSKTEDDTDLVVSVNPSRAQRSTADSRSLPERGKSMTRIMDMDVLPRLHKLRNLDEVTLGSSSSRRTYGLGKK